MSTRALSNLKILTAVSFYSILLVFSNLMVLPMLFTLMLGLGSLVSGNPSGFIFSCLGLLASGYLIISAVWNRKKVHYYKTGCSILVLVALAVYGIVESGFEMPVFSWISYLVFFVSVLSCLFGFIRRDKPIS